MYVVNPVVMSDTREQDITRLIALFGKLTKANLAVNLLKCEFAKPQVSYLGYLVGYLVGYLTFQSQETSLDL